MILSFCFIRHLLYLYCVQIKRCSSRRPYRRKIRKWENNVDKESYLEIMTNEERWKALILFKLGKTNRQYTIVYRSFKRCC